MNERLVTTAFDDPTSVVEGTPAKRRGNPEALAEYRRKVAAGEIVPKPKTPAVKKNGRPRDSQRSKLYEAERVLDGWINPDGMPTLSEHLDDAQDWIDEVTAEAWFQRRWGRMQVRLVPGRGNNAMYRGRIMLSPWGRSRPYVLLHELAHVLVPNKYAGHGPEFCATYLTLVEFVLGKEAARKLRESFVSHGVRYRKGFEAVPDPNRSVVTKSQADAKKRREALARQKFLATSALAKYKRQDAAEIIRAMVALGKFGKAGSKTRSQALAVAREVEAA